MMGLEFLTQGRCRSAARRINVIVKDDQLRPDRGRALLEECYNDDHADLAVGTTARRWRSPCCRSPRRRAAC